MIHSFSQNNDTDLTNKSVWLITQNESYNIRITLVTACTLWKFQRVHVVEHWFCFQNSNMSELKTRVEELKMENEYQLRLKDMNYNEKMKELTEKFIQEMESLKTKNQVSESEPGHPALPYS